MYKENSEKGGRDNKYKTRDADKTNGNSTDKCYMIHGSSHSSEECKFLSDFGRKLSGKCPPKDHKRVNNNAFQEANGIVTEAVETVIHNKKKVNKRKSKIVKRNYFPTLRL